jgi:hypothetical protein
MRIQLILIMLMIMQSVITVVAAEEPVSKEEAMKAFADDLAVLNQEILKATNAIQQAQNEKTSTVTPGNLAVTVTSEKGSIHTGASKETAVLTKVEEGKSFPVIDKVGDWYAVSLDDPVRGMETGWISSEESVPSVIPAGVIDDAINKVFIEQYQNVLNVIYWLQKKNSNNPFITISGFSIGVKPLSATIHLDFKQSTE